MDAGVGVSAAEGVFHLRLLFSRHDAVERFRLAGRFGFFLRSQAFLAGGEVLGRAELPDHLVAFVVEAEEWFEQQPVRGFRGHAAAQAEAQRTFVRSRMEICEDLLRRAEQDGRLIERDGGAVGDMAHAAAIGAEAGEVFPA